MIYNKYNTKRKNFKQLTFEHRKLIEMWLGMKFSKAEIARLLGVSRSTLYNELERGTVKQMKSDLTEYEKYFAERGQMVYEENRSRCKKTYKFAKAINFIEDIEKEIKDNKLSPDTACGKLKKNKTYDETVCTKTIYNYIDKGLMEIKNIDLVLKVRLKIKKNRVRKNKRKFGDSIENRPQEINERTEFGHWEIDTVAGTKGSDAVLLTLDERKTRKRIIVKLPNKTMFSVKEGISKIVSSFGEKAKYIFKSITSDNGSEFSGLSEAIPFAHIYYAHPYSSFERGTNEKQNSLIRRFYPKGTDFTDINENAIQKVEDWINNLPRKLFKYSNSNELFAEELIKIEIPA